MTLFKSFLGVAVCFVGLIPLGSCTLVSGALISEFQPDPVGPDPTRQRFELSGPAGEAFTGFVLGIGGEARRFGTVDTVSQIMGTFDSNGILLAEIDDLFNPTLTVVLVDNYDESLGPTDIDLNDDGTADNLSRLVGIRDAIGIADEAPDEFRLYGEQLGGADFRFTGDEPRLVFRDVSVGQFFAINAPANGQVFDTEANDVLQTMRFNGDPFTATFGGVNPSITAVPEPTSVAAMAAAGGLWLRRRRRGRRSR